MQTPIMTTEAKEPRVEYRPYLAVIVFVGLALLSLPALAAFGLVLQFAFAAAAPALLLVALVYALVTPSEN